MTETTDALIRKAKELSAEFNDAYRIASDERDSRWQDGSAEERGSAYSEFEASIEPAKLKYNQGIADLTALGLPDDWYDRMTVQQLIDALAALGKPDLPVFIVDDRETYPASAFDIFVLDDGKGPYVVMER